MTSSLGLLSEYSLLQEVWSSEESYKLFIQAGAEE